MGRLKTHSRLRLLFFKRQLEIFRRRKHSPNFHIVMPGDPPTCTLFPLSRCGLAGTISYGALRLASFIHQVRIVPFPFTTILSSSFSTRSSISYLCLLDSLNVFFTGLSIVERGFAQRRFASRLFSFFLFSVGSVMLLASEVKGYFHHCCCCYWWHRPA